MTGFLTDGGKTHIARPVGLAMARDGALLMADDANGVIYRIAYAGQRAQGRSACGGTGRPDAGAGRPRGIGVPLALEREGGRAPRVRIKVASATFEPDGAIPAKHSEYADGVSPPLAWSAVDGAASYVIVMEDPDAKPIKPFVHWVAWNIPANVTSLPEGLQEQPRLTEPEGVLQGRNKPRLGRLLRPQAAGRRPGRTAITSRFSRSMPCSTSSPAPRGTRCLRRRQDT